MAACRAILRSASREKTRGWFEVAVILTVLQTLLEASGPISEEQRTTPKTAALVLDKFQLQEL